MFQSVDNIRGTYVHMHNTNKYISSNAFKIKAVHSLHTHSVVCVAAALHSAYLTVSSREAGRKKKKKMAV